MKTTVLKQVKELTTTVQPDALEPADIAFSASADITNLCRHFGQVDSPDPSKCHATGKGLEVGIVGQTSTAILQACNSKGEPCTYYTEPVTSLECKLVWCHSNRQFQEVRGTESIRDQLPAHHQGEAPATYQQLIRVSPFRPAVTSSIMNLGAPIHTIAGVKHPWGIAINHKGSRDSG